MFTLDELQLIFQAIDERKPVNTNEARNKAALTLKLCDLLDDTAKTESEPVAVKDR